MTGWSFFPPGGDRGVQNRENSTRAAGIAVDPGTVLARITDPALKRIGDKFFSGERLDRTDGLTCLGTPDLLGLGSLASAAKRARHGDSVFYVVNRHLNYTNICMNGCRFCAFYRSPGSEEGYLMSPEEAADEVRTSYADGLREVHLVGAINPEAGFSYYLDLLKAIKSQCPRVRIKAYTAVEIDRIAKLASLSWTDCLVALRDAGLDAMPGGGAEVFSERIRQELFPTKIGADDWLGIHGAAHRLGIGTNATLLFGHIETLAERVEHLLRLRSQQDETGGFRAFIPLVFHPGNTPLAHLPAPTGADILRTIATSRLILDNVPNMKAYWVMLGLKQAQTALHFGADDLEGTIVKEKIAHQAGARTAAGLSREELEHLIVEAGFAPVERDTFHHSVEAA